MTAAIFSTVLPVLPWMDLAACTNVDPELFYPIALSDYHIKDGQRSRVQQAKAVCRACPVMGQCLEFALELGDHEGIFGGTTPDERRPR